MVGSGLGEDRCASQEKQTPTRSGQVLGNTRGEGGGGVHLHGSGLKTDRGCACHPTSLFGRLGLCGALSLFSSLFSSSSSYITSSVCRPGLTLLQVDCHLSTRNNFYANSHRRNPNIRLQQPVLSSSQYPAGPGRETSGRRRNHWQAA